MLFRPLCTALVFLLLSFYAAGAVIGTRSIQGFGSEGPLKTTTQTTLESPAVSIGALSPKTEHGNNGVIFGVRRAKVDWREDEALREEAMREAGFRPDSFYKHDDASPTFGPLFKICIGSAIVMCIIKVVRDLRK